MFFLASCVIIGCGKNNPPLCSIINPEQGAVIEIGDTVIISADAIDEDGIISEVRFFVNDSGVGSDKDFPYQYPWNTRGSESGDYNLKAMSLDTEGGTSDDEITITLIVSSNLPDADFSSETTTVMEGDTIRFYDETTSNPQSWNWDFGDGNSSTDQNPEKVYSTAGTYTVSLEVSNTYGSDRVEKTDYIVVQEYCMGCDTASVLDYDGNRYLTVKIGQQWWMAENLNAKHFSNGDAINFYPDSTSMYNANSPGYTYYQYNEEMYGDTYGALYNWWVAVDSRNVCPADWHVPLPEDWEQLVEGLGGENIAGLKLKSTSDDWRWGNEDATNESGFNGLPSGSTTGLNLGILAGYWTNQEMADNLVYYRMLYANSSFFSVRETWKNFGFSIRCVKNQD